MRLPERVVDFSGDVLWLRGPTTSLGKQKQAAATVIVIVVVVIVVAVVRVA